MYCCIRVLFLQSQRRKCRCLALVLGILLIYVTYCSVIYSNRHSSKLNAVDLANNYFKSEAELNRRLLIDSESCRIPDIQAWSNDYFSSTSGKALKRSCRGKLPKLTYTDGDKVVVDVEVLKRVMGYNWDSVLCCYRTIIRIQANPDKHDMDADNQIRYSEDCVEMGLETQPKAKFIKVICSRKWTLFGAYFYEKFHAIPVLTNPEIQSKINFWKNCTSQKLCRTSFSSVPPNVLVIGIGSTSRLNFRRFMNRTVNFLTKLGAVEMMGYSKVGESTLSNLFPMLTSAPYGGSNCTLNTSDSFDDCPFLWRNFSARNYVTAFLEDSPQIGIFNFKRTGFIREPVDVYFRPLALAMYRQKGVFQFSLDCSGYERPDEMVLRYAADWMKSATSNNMPAFITTWLSDLTHEHMSELELMDDVVTATLESLYENGILNNSLLFIVGDHGYRLLPIRNTLSGWYEDKLPVMWVRPPTRKTRKWGDALIRNSRRLTTPFDVHTTLLHLLNSDDAETDMFPHEKYGVSLFEAGNGTDDTRSRRSCAEAGIAAEFCPCDLPVKFEDPDVLRTAAQAVVKKINSLVPEKECVELQLSSVVTSGVMRAKSDNPTGLAGLTSLDRLTIQFVTTPGMFEFDAIIEYDHLAKMFSNVTYFGRSNSPTLQVDCVANVQSRHVLFCFCTSWESFWMPKVSDAA